MFSARKSACAVGAWFVLKSLAVTSVFANPVESCTEGEARTCISIVGIQTTKASDAEEVVDQIAKTFAEAEAENPQSVRRISNLGSRALDFITRKIMVRSKVPIEDLTPGQRAALYFSTPEYRENFAAALIRGSVNGVVSSATFVFSDKNISCLEILPNALTLFFMSGAIQVGIDPFHEWLTNGKLTRQFIPGMKQKPSDPEELAVWQAKFDRWSQREFYAKWFFTQFVFMIGVDLALIPTGVWDGQSLSFILMKTVVNSLFAMFAEGAPEGSVVAATRGQMDREIERSREAGTLTPETETAIKTKYDRVRRSLVGLLAVTSTALGSLRNTKAGEIWRVFVPTDVPGAVLCAMGTLGVMASKFAKWARGGCAQQLGNS